MSTNHGLRFDETRFWVIHRRLEYGPFDYEWSQDFRGVELTYQGTKFGEICSAQEIHADLKEFALPMRVVQVASLVFGCMLLGVKSGFSAGERASLLNNTLLDHGCGHFVTPTT
ncbi:MAG: hypothetical protein KDA58_00510 [Planctomycetaceae bacterium]|nr:hypothetical protein [Planctomycetaceae bacterium]